MITEYNIYKRGITMKNKFTKLLALLTAAVIIFSLAACGKEKSNETTAPVTAAAGETTALAEESTNGQGDTTAVSETTTTEQVATTGNGETTAEGETTSATEVKNVPSTKAEILTAYTAAMNKAKTDKPAFTKYEYQALPQDKINISKGGKLISFVLSFAGRFMTTEDKAKKNPGVNAKGNNMSDFPVKYAPKGCMITNTGAIKTAKCDVLSNGNYQLTLVLKDEMNPEHYQSGTTSPSNTGGMFTPLSPSDFEKELNSGIVKATIGNLAYSMKYFDCTSVLTYNPATSQIVSLNQVTYTVMDISGRIKPLFTDAAGTAILEMHYKYFEFAY